jgi:hypothetical protein
VSTHIRTVVLRPIPLVLIAVAVALLVSDVAPGRLNSFWGGHQVVAGIVTEALLVVFLIVVIDELRDVWDEAEWSRVGNISYKALMDSIRHSRDALLMLDQGSFPYDSPPEFAVRWQPAAKRIVAAAGVAHHERVKRLDYLMTDADWVEVAYRVVRASKEDAQAVLGHWAPLMLRSHRLCKAFDKVAHVADALEDLQRPVHPVHRVCGAIKDSERRERAGILVDELVTTIVVLEESLMHEIDKDRPGWTTRAREFLSAEGESRLGSASAEQLFYDRLKNACKAVRDQYPTSRDAALGRTAPHRGIAPHSEHPLPTSKAPRR